MRYGLTEKQKKIFYFIKSYMSKNPVAPSYEDIMKATGYKSRNSINVIVKQLEERKWITRLPGKSRSIQIIQ